MGNDLNNREGHLLQREVGLQLESSAVSLAVEGLSMAKLAALKESGNPAEQVR